MALAGARDRACGFASEAAATASQAPQLLETLQDLRRVLEPGEAEQQRLQAESANLQACVATGPIPARLEVLQAVADLGALPGRPYNVAAYLLFFLDSYVEELETLRDGETISDRAAELGQVFTCFHMARLHTDKLKAIYAHIEHEFPRLEAAGALLPMPAAVRLCHTMLDAGLSAAPAVTVLLRSALREPLVHVAEDAWELRLLKAIEFLVRVDFLHTQEQLPRDVSEYLAVVRSLRYYDSEIDQDTPLSYQLAFFLRKHGFPSKRYMMGPYPLKVCDPEERINFEPLEVDDFRLETSAPESPSQRKKRHLEAVGWRSIEVNSRKWKELENYDRKAAHVRTLLKENDLLSL